MQNPDRRSPRTATNSPRAEFKTTHCKFTSTSPVCATLWDVAMAAVPGALLAMLAVQWLDWSLAGAACRDHMVQVGVAR